ncbi:hypothetical protein ACFW04_003215 [Cataglyphis niger]
MTAKNEKLDDDGKKNANKEAVAADNSTNNGLWGSDMYPERRGTKKNRNWFKMMFGFEGRESIDKTRCEDNVYRCVKDSTISLIYARGEVDIRRHISCEVCNPAVTGGYDSELNQIVVCQNMAGRKNVVRGVLLHEMIHMFDYCRNKLDTKNIDHLACTEIRAANIGHCSFMSSLLQGNSSFINIKATHQNCVKEKAKFSIMAVHEVTAEIADAAIERVFTKCYNDLEPVGRRIRRNSDDMPRAYAEAHLYGYD